MTLFTKDFEWLAYLGTILSSLIAFYVFILLLNKRKEKPSNILNYLIGMIGFLGLAAFVDFIFFTIGGFYNILRDQYDLITYGTNISFTCNAIANILLLKFTKATFYEKTSKPLWILLYIIELSIGPLLFLGQYLELDTLYFFLPHVIASFSIYLLLSINAFQLRRKLILNEPNEQIPIGSLKYIGLSGILLFIAVMMFILHEVFLTIHFREYITVALGWILGSIAGWIIYVGYSCPDWIKKRWELKK